MKPSIQKLKKIFKLEAERRYDNHAVVGGLERMLEYWEPEARADGLPEELLQAILTRLRDYARLTEKSRAEALQGIWRRIQRSEAGLSTQTPFDADSPSETAAPSEPPKAAVSPAPGAEQPGLAASATPPAQPEAVESVATPSARPKARTVSGAPSASVEPAALNAPITVLHGIGPRNAEVLARLGLHTLRDMLYYFPRRYDDYSTMKPINRLWFGEVVTVIANVQSVTARPLRGGSGSIVEAIVSDGSGSLRVTWFNQPWLTRRLHKGAYITLSGKVDQYLGRLVMNSPDWEDVDQVHLNTGRITPVYALTAQVTQGWLRKQMNQLVTFWAPRVQDTLPESVRLATELPELSNALLQIHFPDSAQNLKAAQQRLAFDEIFLLQMGVLSQKRQWQNRAARAYPCEQNWLEQRLERLPFQLTGAQSHALEDVRGDLASGHPMDRLIQGDVGSGKTVIAGLASAIVMEHGAQACLMAPTSILAEQHYRTLLKMFLENGTPESEIRLLIGATPESEKREIRAGLADGSIKLAVGTHALIEDPVEFANLALAVVDEQHRFGVEQRAALRAKGDNLHLLVMTATPIPRSLALTVYGDLDLTVLDELPPGRQPVSTHVLTPRERERAYRLIRSQIELGRQAFIIYPLIEESENSEARAAVAEQARLQKEIFPDLKVGLLHGRLKPDEKEAAMQAFRDREYHILVSTTVIEVGVDIPNATVMLVEGANRFGLAQLHQLRGRVGRGSDQAFCMLIPDQADETENERLLVMANTNDGFVLAEKDLEQRGPGQFLGTRQAGFNELRMANLTDVRLIEKARRLAQALFEADPELAQPENQLLAPTLQRFWGGGKGDIS